MKFCSNCGNQIKPEQDVCLNCGKIVNSNKAKVSEKDTGHIGWAFLGFFVPIAGLILYLIWIDERPLDAKKAGKGALISVIASAVIFMLYVILAFVFYVTMFS